MNYYDHLDLKPGFKFFQSLSRLNRPIDKYALRIPTTYYSEEQKLLVYDPAKGYLARAETTSVAHLKAMLEMEANDHNKLFVGNDAELDAPAYMVRKRTGLHDFIGKSVCLAFISEYRK